MDARASKFREHLRCLAGGVLPSYAECLGRVPRRRRTAWQRWGQSPFPRSRKWGMSPFLAGPR